MNKREAMPIGGSRARRAKLNCQPRVNAITKPETQRPIDMSNAPNLSPIAFSIDSVSFAMREDNSYGFIESNQAMSCSKIAFKYAILTLLVTLCAKIKRNEK